jgi:hypothetical protein
LCLQMTREKIKGTTCTDFRMEQGHRELNRAFIRSELNPCCMDSSSIPPLPLESGVEDATSHRRPSTESSAFGWLTFAQKIISVDSDDDVSNEFSHPERRVHEEAVNYCCPQNGFSVEKTIRNCSFSNEGWRDGDEVFFEGMRFYFAEEREDGKRSLSCCPPPHVPTCT